jgi:hypothetical protein
VATASAVRWVRAWRTTATVSATPQGGDLRSHRIEAYREIILSAIDGQVDITLVELADMLRTTHGASFASSMRRCRGLRAGGRRAGPLFALLPLVLIGGAYWYSLLPSRNFKI